MKRLLLGIAIGLAISATAARAEGMYVTGYDEPGTTADGTPTGPGVAACPRWMAFGTALLVDGIGQVVCHDRYAGWLSDRVDVWLPTVAACYAVTGVHDVQMLGGGQ